MSADGFRDRMPSIYWAAEKKRCPPKFSFELGYTLA